MSVGRSASRGIIFITIIAVIMLVAGYSLGSSNARSVETRTVTVVTTSYGISVTVIPDLKISVIDSLGREILFDRPPGRVVSLAPSITEMLFSLGIGDRVVGVTSHCDYPPEVPELVRKGSIEVVGGFWAPDLEKLLALKPDLVVASAGTGPHLRLKDSLEQAGIKVVYIKGNSATDKYEIYSDIRILAKIFGVSNAAEELISRVEKEIEFVEEATQGIEPPKVLFLLGPPAWGLYAAGGNTFIDWAIKTAGGTNIAGKFWGWPLLDYEFILSEDPDVIIVSAMGMDYAAIAEEIGKSPLAHTNAFRSSRVYFVDQEANNILVRPGPRLGLAVRLLAALLHPSSVSRVEIPVVYRIGEGAVITSSLRTAAQPPDIKVSHATTVT